MTLAPGDTIDNKYEIVRLLGEGGMGAVFEGRNRLIERRVAIKVLHAEARAAPGVVERFEREARAAGMIGGDHILEVLDLGSLPGGERYMVMEFLDGETLASRMTRRGRMSMAELVPLLRQALVGLRGAHAAGIVHRDLKPDNLFILREKAGHKDFLKIIDFGVSKFGGPSSEFRMTKTGSVMGTPYYMSPEQAKGASGVNHQSDLYSLGVIAFEALTGQVPFEGTSFNDLMFKIVLSEMPDVERIVPEVDPRFAAIIRRAMAKEVSQRYQSADEFIADLDQFAGVSASAPGANSRSWSGGPPSSAALGPGSRATGVGSLASTPGSPPHPRHGPHPGKGTPAQGARTNAEWAHTNNTEPPVAPVVKGRGPLYAAVAAVALAAVGGVYAATRPSGAEPGPLVPESAAPVSQLPEPKVTPAPPADPIPSAPQAVQPGATPNEGSVGDTSQEGDSGAETPQRASGSQRASQRASASQGAGPKVAAVPVRASEPQPAKPAPPEPPPPAPKVAEPAEPAPRKEAAAPPVRPAPEKPVRRSTTPVRDFGY